MKSVFVIIFISFLLNSALTQLLIMWKKKLRVGQFIREDGPKSHYNKQGTPTIGGLPLIFTVILLSLFGFSNYNTLLMSLLICFFGFGIVGLLDDLSKFFRGKNLGLKAKYKLLAQIVVGAVISFLIKDQISSVFWLPIVPYSFDFDVFFIIWIIFIIVSWSNAFNLTDGLDGLIGWLSFIFFAFIFLLIALDGVFFEFIKAEYIPLKKNLLVFLGALLGSLLGFLWFNHFPAQIFMGDTGALALGSVFGFFSIILKSEILFFFIGIVCIIEVFSVILQVFFFKVKKGKRLFKMAPLHHHFELSGVPETKITSRFLIITLLVCVFIFYFGFFN